VLAPVLSAWPGVSPDTLPQYTATLVCQDLRLIVTGRHTPGVVLEATFQRDWCIAANLFKDLDSGYNPTSKHAAPPTGKKTFGDNIHLQPCSSTVPYRPTVSAAHKSSEPR